MQRRNVYVTVISIMDYSKAFDTQQRSSLRVKLAGLDVSANFIYSCKIGRSNVKSENYCECGSRILNKRKFDVMMMIMIVVVVVVNTLYSKQFGFRGNHFTTHALIEVVDTIKKSLI